MNTSLEASLASANNDGPPIPILQNVVSTVSLGCKVDLKMLACKARNAEYNPRRFHAVILRQREPKTTCLVFPSGKLVITRAKSEVLSKLAARMFMRCVMKTGDYKPSVDFDFKIQNIVASCGKVVITGAKDREDTYKAWELM